MKKLVSLCSFFSLFLMVYAQPVSFRPPSVPLVTHDPYFSIWSPADRLWDAETVHWTGKKQALHSVIRIDGKSWRLMGSRPSYCEPIPQKSLTVSPTRTIYVFENSNIRITLTFTSPLLPDDMDLISRPVTYIGWKVESIDGKEHKVQLYFDSSAELAVDKSEQVVSWDQPAIEGQKTLRVGSVEQPVLQKRGDDLRIDWGYAYLSVPADHNPAVATGPGDAVRKQFATDGRLLSGTVSSTPVAVRDGLNVMAASWELTAVGASPQFRYLMLAYDDLYSIRYFGKDLIPYWRKNGSDMLRILKRASDEYQSVTERCEKFDRELVDDLTAAGGQKYALITSLVYRECLAAHKITADAEGQPLVFSKENFSNGCIATVDVIYPASPFFLLFSPALTKAMLKPLLDYSSSGLWKWPFAPHDLGTYPHATGQAYGGGGETEEDQMPVEETGNMLIMMDALAKAEGNADFANAHWPLMEKWADYLLSKGFDPENQLCTDDFAGHLAHNINLSAKAIVAIAAYADLCRMTGRNEQSQKYRQQAESFAKDWVRLATEGEHTRLAYDQPGTWSQKYNLVWDKLLNFNLFAKEVIQKEIDFYKKVQAPYGLPLDNRERWTKTDWILWTATMAEKRSDFDALFSPVFNFVNATPQRVPVTDWYVVDNAYLEGFQARPVIGGLFIKLLENKEVWSKWFGRGSDASGSWAPLPMVTKR
ncbi:MAG: DUF4965 domain-containing protein [Bacteroidota bacterium]